jgi:hypothetical protein
MLPISFVSEENPASDGDACVNDTGMPNAGCVQRPAFGLAARPAGSIIALSSCSSPSPIRGSDRMPEPRRSWSRTTDQRLPPPMPQRPVARVVGRTHDCIISAGVQDRHARIGRPRRQPAASRERVAAFAHRTDDSRRSAGQRGVGRRYWDDTVPRVIHSRADQSLIDASSTTEASSTSAGSTSQRPPRSRGGHLD